VLLESRYLELSFDVERMRCCILTEPYRFLGIVFDGLLVNEEEFVYGSFMYGTFFTLFRLE